MDPSLKEKRWSKELEKGVWKEWEKERAFEPSPGGKPLLIDTPPPYPSGRPWHIGAASHYGQIDMIARAARLLGWSVHFPIGIDRNGLPVEMYTEKKHGISIHSTPREKYIEHCKNALDDLEAEMISIMKAMGLSGDFRGRYRTDSEEYRKNTQTTFIDLWKRGLIYVDTRPNNYCIKCGTTIADAEVLYEERDSQLVHIKFPVKGGGELVIATTRPELLCSCQLVIVNPKDDRYRKLHGKKVSIPIYGREIEVRPHKEALPDFGTGAMMVCSYGDFGDVRIFRELGLEETIAIDVRGRMASAAGKYAGLKAGDARKRITEELEKRGLVVKKEGIKHRTPLCERSRTEIEIIPMPEYYLKQMECLKTLEGYAKEIKFYPDHHRSILLNWMGSVTKDWPVSRRRYYATEIPIWYCRECKEPHLPEPGEYYRPWKDKAPFKECVKCGGKEFVGEERTFDTWMDSSITPLFVAGYFSDKQFFGRVSGNILRPQSKDIVRTWLYYTLLRCHQLTGKNIFRHAWIMGYGVDERGKKMSKSKGNVIDPIPILEKYGADTFRFWSAQESSLGSDFRCSEERISGAGKFLTKLWNTARFISAFGDSGKAPPSPLDRWILGELSGLVDECGRGYEGFNFFVPSNRIRDFLWNVFAPHYMEMVKARAYSGDKAAICTLNKCLKTMLVLLSPITPFITDFIYRELYGSSVFKERFPEAWGKENLPFSTEELLELNSAVWKAKKERGLSLKDGVKELRVGRKFSLLEKDLKAAHGAESLVYGKELGIVL